MKLSYPKTSVSSVYTKTTNVFKNLHPGDLRQFLVPEKEPRAARNEGVGFFATLLFCKHSIAKIRTRRILREKADCKQLTHDLSLKTFLTFAQVVNIRHIAVSCPLVVGQCRCLSVGLVTDVTRVWFVVGVDYMVLV